jgi:hypothetical protein
MAPTGKIIKGHVLDVDQKKFDEALQHYDRELYTKWNPKKVSGWGCWEIRRRPEFLTALDACEFEGNLILKVGPYENDLVHHVLDCAFLNYDQLRRIQEMDAWKFGSAEKWQEDVERRGREAQALAQSQGMKLRREASRTFKREIKAFKEFVKSGGNPHLIAQHWDRVKELE